MITAKSLYVYRCFWLGFSLLILHASATAGINNQTIAILVNKNDPESIEIAEYYQRARQVPVEHVIYLDFKAGDASLSEREFRKIRSQLDEKVPDKIQAYALAWRMPWKVECMSITTAFSLGFNREYCAQGCKLTRSVSYFNSQTESPYTDYAIRPSMLLSSKSIQGVKELIDRGVSSDYMRPVGSAYLLSTSDKQRNVRSIYYPAILSSLKRLLNIELISADAVMKKNDVMFYFTGRKNVPGINDNAYFPGAIADHLTSYGGQIFGGSQMSVLEWIDAGLTGSYGTVVEPCNFNQKFPNPKILMKKYLSGNTLLESYWKSVEMPGQGLFVGEPLASPFKGCDVITNRQGVLIYSVPLAENYVDQKYRSCH